MKNKFLNAEFGYCPRVLCDRQIVLPIAITLCQASGVNPLPFAVGITVISALAIATPLGAGFVAYVAMAGYGFKDFLRYGWLFAVVSCVLVIVGTPLFFPF